MFLFWGKIRPRSRLAADIRISTAMNIRALDNIFKISGFVLTLLTGSLFQVAKCPWVMSQQSQRSWIYYQVQGFCNWKASGYSYLTERLYFSSEKELTVVKTEWELPWMFYFVTVRFLWKIIAQIRDKTDEHQVFNSLRMQQKRVLLVTYYQVSFKKFLAAFRFEMGDSLPSIFR